MLTWLKDRYVDLMYGNARYALTDRGEARVNTLRLWGRRVA